MTTAEQVILTNSTVINGVSARTVLVDGSISSAASPYVLNNNVIAVCDTSTYGNVFVQLARGTYTDTTTSQSTSATDQYFVVENVGAGTVTLTTTAGLTIDGSASYTIASNVTVRFVLMDTIWRPILISQPLSSVIQSIGSSTTNAVVRWSGTAGNAFNNSLVTINSSNNITLPTVAATNITGSLITGTSTFTNTANTLAAQVQNTTAGSTSVLISGYPITGSLTSFSNNVVVTGFASSTTKTLGSATTCTDTIILSNTGLSTTPSITNSILLLARANYASNISDALFLAPFGLSSSVFTNVGARVTMVGALSNTSLISPLAFGDDHLMIRSRTALADKPAARSLMIGGGGVIDMITSAASADIIYIGSTNNTSSGSVSNTDNRVISIGISTLTAQNGTNVIGISCNNTLNTVSSTSSILLCNNTQMTSATDSIAVTANQIITAPARTIFMGKAGGTTTFTNLADVTHITSGVNTATDITKGGISVFSTVSSTGTGNTGFGNSATGANAGTNNTLLGASIAIVTTQVGILVFGTSITSTAGVITGTFIGNGYSSAVNTSSTALVIGSGAITPTAGRIHIGTATKPLSTTNAVGAAGTASAPPTPAQYLRIGINGTQLRIPLFNP